MLPAQSVHIAPLKPLHCVCCRFTFIPPYQNGQACLLSSHCASQYCNWNYYCSSSWTENEAGTALAANATTNAAANATVGAAAAPHLNTLASINGAPADEAHAEVDMRKDTHVEVGALARALLPFVGHDGHELFHLMSAIGLSESNLQAG